MRELKFRIWNNNHNEFIRPDYGLIGFCYPLDGKIAALTTNGDPIEDCVIEQYTGLKDRHGKEIFIGDIVSEHDGDIVGEIIQKPSGEYCIAWIGIYGGSSVLYDELSMCEVIGNIHENVDLLEEE